MKELQRILPEFPRTPHLPFEPNLGAGDIVASDDEARSIFAWERKADGVKGVYGARTSIEEKIDGASCGMTLFEGHPVIRNRDHILRKGYIKDTSAKKQFVPAWGWFYDHMDSFESLLAHGEYSVYGEWMVAAHGIHYTRLPSLFIAYDIYDYGLNLFLPTNTARQILSECGFTTPVQFFDGELRDHYDSLAELTQKPAAWADDKVEGIYLKVYTDKEIVHRFKMVRADFKRGQYWDKKTITKNKVIRCQEGHQSSTS